MNVEIEDGYCFHCGLPNESSENYPVVILNKQHFMCCPGCQAVASAIVSNGLENYYEFRTEPAARGDEALNNTMSALSVYDEPDLQDEFVIDEGEEKQIQLTVEGITCAACGWLIEKQLAKLDGVRQISVNVSARRAMLTWNNETIQLSRILQKLKSIGYSSLPFQPDEHEASYKREQKTLLKKLGLAGIMTMQVMMLTMGQYFDVFGNIDTQTLGYFNAVSLLLTTPVVLYSGSIFYISAIKALQARTVNMDVPVTIAIVATYVAGLLAVNNETGDVYFESICMFIFFLLIGRYLEHRARHKASEISSNMLKLIPATALKKVNNEWHSVLAKQLQVNDKVLVKSGESIPIDGVIYEGSAAIDESMLTGEFEPVFKSTGHQVFAGTINRESPIEVKVTHQLKFSMMSQILRLQEFAVSQKPKIAVMADKLSSYFVAAVLVISALTFLFWTYKGNSDAFWITISILVATCPCALGLATPSALTCAMAKLNQKGILLKRADVLEQLTQASTIVFDKTGTLTQGKFSLEKVVNLSGVYDDSYILALAAFIESRSEHPIGKAFNAQYDTQDFQLGAFNVEVGSGIKAVINSTQYHMGSKEYASSAASTDVPFDVESANVLLVEENKLIAAFWVTDTLQPEAKSLIKELHGYETTILSGDDIQNVLKISRQLSVDKAVGNQTPQGKLDYIKQLQQRQKSVVMLGDGINDAPVLAAADVSIAVGNASDLAKNAADIILLNPKLYSLIDLIRIAHNTKNKIKQNIAWALSYNLLVLPFAMVGFLSPWQAALGMSLSSLIVVYNSTRLMRQDGT